MNRGDYLRSRAALLRKVAKAIDIRSIRDRVLALAEECLVLAKLVEKTDVAPAAARARSRERSKARPKRARRAKRVRG